MEKAIFKFNGGIFAILCTNCSVIIKTGRDFTLKEFKAINGKAELSSQFCTKCTKILTELV